MKGAGSRERRLAALCLAVLLLLLIAVSGALLSGRAAAADFSQRDLSPNLRHPFGTDALGRDMLSRTLCGLSMSIRIGLLAASVSACAAALLGGAAAVGGRAADACITWIIDLMMGVPHMLLLILIAFAAGKGAGGVVAGVAATHWMTLARVIRGEILQLRENGYILAARKLGAGRLRIAFRHMAPHLLPQFLAGLVLLFPHAILHEASVTFLGFGLSQEQSAIGAILSESMRYLVLGEWWLSVLPGLMLVLTVLLFSWVGSCLQGLIGATGVYE